MHHRRIVPPLHLFLFTAACGAWTPQPGASEPGGTSSSSGTTGESPAEPEPTTWPTPPEWGALPPDLGLPDPSTTSGTGSGGPVLTDSGSAAGVDLAAFRITEVLADPDGKDGGPLSPEFVEITHVGADPLALAGLVVAARSWPDLWMGDLGIGGETLLPGERLLLQRYASVVDLPVPPILREGGVLRAAFADGGGLRNTDGAVSLRDQDGALGDAVIYGAHQPAPYDDPALWVGDPVPTPGGGKSLCRIDLASDTDEAADWTACAPTPGDLPAPADDTTGEPPLPATVVIVEVLSNPVGPANLEKHAEFVEIENLGPGTVDLGEFWIADSTDPDAPGIDPLLYFGGDGGCAPSTCLAPGRKALVVGSLYEGPVGDALVLKTDDTAIANAGLGNTEAVVLRDGLGEIRSSYRAWPDPFAEPDPTAQEAAVVRVAADAADEPVSWAFATPTPGL